MRPIEAKSIVKLIAWSCLIMMVLAVWAMVFMQYRTRHEDDDSAIQDESSGAFDSSNVEEGPLGRVLDPNDDNAYIYNSEQLRAVCRDWERDLFVFFTPMRLLDANIAVVVKFPDGHPGSPSEAQLRTFDFIMEHFEEKMGFEVLEALYKEHSINRENRKTSRDPVFTSLESMLDSIIRPAVIGILPQEKDGYAYCRMLFFNKAVPDSIAPLVVCFHRDEIVDFDDELYALPTRRTLSKP